MKQSSDYLWFGNLDFEDIRPLVFLEREDINIVCMEVRDSELADLFDMFDDAQWNYQLVNNEDYITTLRITSPIKNLFDEVRLLLKNVGFNVKRRKCGTKT